jgi:hypothetical protein
MRLSVLFVFAPGLFAQAWVPLGPESAFGVIAADQPLPPMVFGNPALTNPPVFEFAGAGFVRRPESLPSELARVQAAAFDPMHQRLVVYSSVVPLFGGQATAAVGVFDGARWNVLATPTPTPPRLSPAFAFDPVRGSLILYGGLVAGFPNGTPLGDTWELVGETWQAIPVGGPPPRSGSRLTRAPGGRLVLFGGMGSAGRLADTWTWNGAAWQAHLPTTVPPARTDHALAFDPAANRTVMYGGTAFAVSPVSGVLGDAWQWDGTNWSPAPVPQPTPLGVPALAHDGQRLLLVARDGDPGAPIVAYERTAGAWQVVFRDPGLPDVFQPAHALDAARDELVRFGGRDLYGSTFRDETWVWNDTWQQRSPTVRPPARFGGRMVFDPLRSAVVLFGGVDPNGALADTWTWDGSAWTPHPAATGPAARVYPAMAFDPTRGTVVMVGGTGAAGYLADTWEWNGTNWSPIGSLAPPTGAGAVSMSFDAARQVLVYYAAPAGQPGQLWELGAAGWQLANAAGPSYGPIVYDPGAGNLVAMGPGAPYDYVQGAWVARAMTASSFVASDASRGGILAMPSVGSVVMLATALPPAGNAYGQGCGPFGEVTLGANRPASLGATVALRIRAFTGGVPSFLVFGSFDQNVPIQGACTAWIGGLLAVFGGTAAPHGWAEFGLPIPTAMSLLGANVHAQPVVAYPTELAFGNAVELQVGW